MTVILILIRELGLIPEKIGKGTERLRNQRSNRDNQDYIISKIGQDIKKSPRNLCHSNSSKKYIS